MRVLLGTAWYVPESVGGTEVYVRGLASAMHADGIDVAVAVPVADESAECRSSVDGVPVFRFAGLAGASPRISVQLRQGAGPGWQRVLDSWRPDVVDLHALTSQMGVPHLRAARDFGAHTVITLHQAGVICGRGTLMRFGMSPCTGDLANEPCSACRREARGVPASLAGWATRMGFTGEERARRAQIAAIAHDAGRIVAVSDWLAEMLVRNGVPRTQLRVCRQGTALSAEPGLHPPRAPGPLRVGFVGRMDPVKGLDVLIEAVQMANATCVVELHIWGIARTPEAQAFAARLRARAGDDARIIFHRESDDQTSMYRSMDLLAVPSVCFETGPLVVQEAHAAGVPVMGSNLGGIAERVRDGVDGLLIIPGDVQAWTSALVRIGTHPEVLATLRPEGQARTHRDVQQQTLRTYRELTEAVT